MTRMRKTRHTTQYFEMFGNRGIYQDGWTAVTRHSLPWVTAALPDLNEDEWELYDTNKDWSQAHDLSKEMPEKLREMQDLFMIEAAKYNVFPLDDRRYERFNAARAGRPDLPGGRTSMTFYAGMDHLMENTVLNIKNRSYSVTAEVEVAEGQTDGVIVAQGGRFGGWSLYVKDGAPKFAYNYFDQTIYYVEGTEKLPAGTVNVRYHFDFTDKKPGGGGTGRLYINDKLVGEARIDKTVANIFAADETMDIGADLAMPVTDDYPEGAGEQVPGHHQLGARRPGR